VFVVSVSLFGDVAEVLKIQADMRKLISEYNFTSCACNDGKPGFEKMCQYACEAIKLGDYYIAIQPLENIKK
jgi:hypothetical protein